LLAGFQLDHLVPQGTDDGINRVFACTICNQIKGTFDPSDGEGPPQTEEERTRLISKATEEIFARCKSAPATKYWRVLHLSVLAQKAKHVESLIRKTCAQELHLLDKAIGVVTDSLRRNAGKLCRRPETPAPEAVAALFAKGWKTIQAIKLLALKGYGQDAMGLLRSLTSLTIDLAYIAKEDSDERVMHWAAYAQVQRARLATEMEIALPDEEMPDDQMRARAHKWDGLKIRGRADAAGLLPFYTMAYRLGAWATSAIQRANCVLRSVTELNGRAAKNAWRRNPIHLSTRPFSFPRATAQGCGAKW